MGVSNIIFTLTGTNLSNMSSFKIALNGTTDFISSTKNNDTTYTFPSVS